MDLDTAVKKAPFVLTEGSVIERLRRDPTIALHPLLLNAPFVRDQDSPARRALVDLHRLYIDLARQEGLPILCLTDTWRASGARLAAAGLAGVDLNGEAVRFLKEIRAGSGDFAEKVILAGLLGPSGDAYDPRDSLSPDEAIRFHQPQIEALVAAGVDLLFASTLPALPEAIGIARAFARTGAPFIVSFVVRPEGTLLDGTPLIEATERVDAACAGTPPLGFMVNCVHPSVLRQAIDAGGRPRRLLGLQANASAKSPEELDGCESLDSQDPEAFGRDFAQVAADFDLRVIGGCCGTDERHIGCLAGEMKRLKGMAA